MKKILSLMMLLMAFTVNGFAQVPSWTVAGSSTELFGTAWDPSNTDNDMVLDGSIYKWEKSGVALTTGTIEFKVAKNHNWDTAYPALNYELAIPWDDTYNVSITFDSSTETVHAIAVAKVEIRGGFTNWNEGSPVTLTQDGGVNTYKGVLDLSAYTKNQKMKLIYNGEWLGYNQLTIDAPSGWTYDDETLDHNITLKNGYSGYQTYDLTASWSHSGWTLTIAGKAADTRAESTYTLVGAFFNADWSSEIAATPFGTKWTILDDNQLAKGAGTTYTKTYSNVDFTQEGHVQCKMLKDEDWDTYLEATVDIPAAGRYNIVYTYDKSAQTLTGVATEVPKTVTAVELLGSSNSWASALATFTVPDPGTGYWVASGVEFAKDDQFKVRISYNYGDATWLCPESVGNFLVDEKQLNKELTLVAGGSNNMTVNHAMPLSFSLNPAFTKLTITCDDVYNLVGDESLTGYDWDDTKNEMTINGDGLYEWTANDILVSSTSQPEFKVKKNGTTWYPAGDATTNWKITLTYVGGIEGKYNIKITFNAETDVIGVTPTMSAESVTIGAKGWATTITSNALDFSGVTEFKAYTATLAGTNVTLTPVDDVQAGTGLVLKGDAGTYYVPTIASSETAKGNLIGSDGTYVVNDAIKKCYGLTVDGSGNAKFAKINNGQTITDKKKAFLEVEPSTPANEFTVVFDESGSEATGIQTLNAERNTLYGETYNLAGQKVNKSYKGLVINNGKKVVMK